MGPIRRFIVEYLGNLHLSYRPDRRTNWHARELMDWIKEQMEARGFSESRKHELVEDLRIALRQAEPTSSGLSANHATSEGAPDWVPETKGVSRDAPS